MKNRFESAEIFEAFTVIDVCYLQLEEMRKLPLSPPNVIEQMIDRATGFDKKLYDDRKKAIIELIELIIENKKIIEAPFAQDQELLDKIKNLA
jgi:hypothetical protein